MRARWIVGLLAIAVVALGAMVRLGYLEIPDRWNPWAPLALDERPNFLTHIKLERLTSRPEQCLAVLSRATMRYTTLADSVTGEGCGLRNAVRIEETTAAVGEPFLLTCPAAVSLAMWEQQVLQPAAQLILGSSVARLEHFGSYSCRNLYHRTGARRSEHATANALDVAGFVLADGRRVRVLADWPRATLAGAFLHQVRNGACPFFDAVLSPDYNSAHRDHLHLDRGQFRICR